MADSVSVTSHHSYGSRVGNSLKNILGGIVLVIVSIVLLVRNEKNYVEQKAALDEGASIVQETTADQIDSSLEGKEVHLYGETASSDEALKDDTFGVITDDLKLMRTVEMYQWYEESSESCTDNLGGSEDCETTYTYKKDWDTEAINSDKFYESNGHNNPKSREYQSIQREKNPITLGVYTLTDTFVDKLDNYKTINLSEQNISIPEKYKLIATQTTESNESTSVEDNNNSYLYGDAEENTVADTTVATNEKFHISDNQIYIGLNPAEPAVGDLKITFSSVKPGTVSIVGKQVGKELTSYTVSNGRNIALLEQGSVTAADMFLHAQQANKMMTWILRFVGLLLMFSGFATMLKFIEILAKVIPFLSRIIGFGTGLISLALTITVGFVTIGIAWLAARPVVGISCLVVAAIGIFLLVKGKKSKKENNPEMSEPSKPETSK